MRMADPRNTRTLGRRLASSFLLVSLVSLTVLFFGTVVPHLPDQHLDPHDPVSLVWLLTATLIAVATAFLLSFVIARRVTRPIDDYLETAERFAAGDHSARPADLGPPEFAELAGALVAAADEVERSEAARRQLTSDIAHDLRTPLTALQAGLEELRDGLVPADSKTLSALHAQVTRLCRIVNDLSDLAAAESAEIDVRVQPVDLAEVAGVALTARRAGLDAAGIAVRTEFDPDVVVHADASRAHQVLDNLLANVEHYCRPGDSLVVRVHREGGEGVLEVADTGPGFRAEELPLVFDRTWRGVSSNGTRGTGIGLAIVRALVDAQGGRVAVDSVEGAGATFTIWLPLAPDPHPARPPLARPA
jgi:two-component system sensor histidine kinase BaeS